MTSQEEWDGTPEHWHQIQEEFQNAQSVIEEYTGTEKTKKWVKWNGRWVPVDDNTANDDNNADGIEEWIDDEGNRWKLTGFTYKPSVTEGLTMLVIEQHEVDRLRGIEQKFLKLQGELQDMHKLLHNMCIIYQYEE